MSVSAGKVRIAVIALLGIAGVASLTIAALSAPSASTPVAGVAQPPSRPFPGVPSVAPEPGQMAAPSESPPASSPPSVTSGTWTPLNNQPNSFYPNGIFLLTDGTVLTQDGQLTDNGWWKLTPDNMGSYINGSWSQVASPPNCFNGKEGMDEVYSPLYFASAVLPDGRFVMIGGEYDYNYNSSGEVWTDQCAIYDPVANAWTCIAAPTGWALIGDAQSVVRECRKFRVRESYKEAR